MFNSRPSWQAVARSAAWMASSNGAGSVVKHPIARTRTRWRWILGSRESDQLGLDRGEDARDFGRRPAKILGRKHPQRDRRNGEFGAPFENLVELVGAKTIDRARLDDPERAAMAAVAVEDNADVAGARSALNVAREAARINIIEKPNDRPQQRVPHAPFS